MKLTADQLKLPLASDVRSALIDAFAQDCAEAIFDDGYDSILALIREGCTGVEKYTDEELVEEYMENYHEQEA